ncbi:hypothetical protein FOFC_02459 [Fusarium oxysporum]|nr:hypothetical protein FOFC_02459 [Fusarium oxysporum]
MNTQVEGHGRHYSPYNTLPPPLPPPPRPIEPLLPTMPGQRWQEFSHPRPPSFHQRLPRVKELRSIALVLEIAALSSIFLGIQGASGYFAWFIGQRLSPSLLDTFLPGSQESLLCFVLNTIFFLVVLWGILPFYSIRKELPFFVSGLVVCSVGLLAVALTIMSIHVAFTAWDWSILLEEDGSMSLAKHCRAMSIFLSALWCMGWIFFILSLSYVLNFGVPDFLQQMLVDTRKLLAAAGIKPLPHPAWVDKEDFITSEEAANLLIV